MKEDLTEGIWRLPSHIFISVFLKCQSCQEAFVHFAAKFWSFTNPYDMFQLPPCAVQTGAAAREKRGQVRVAQLSWLRWAFFFPYDRLRNRSQGKTWNSKPHPSSGYWIEAKCSQFTEWENPSPSVEGQEEEGLSLNPQKADVKSLSPSQPSVEITFDPFPVTAARAPALHSLQLSKRLMVAFVTVVTIAVREFFAS